MMFDGSLTVVVSLLLLSQIASKASAFDATECDVYVFRTSENALWHCGDPLPPAPGGGDNSGFYCDHRQGDNVGLFYWKANYPEDWCKFMIATVKQQNEDHYPLTPQIGINETPGPNIYSFTTLKDWGCYTVEGDVVTHSWLVDSRNGKHASTTTEECTRNSQWFKEKNTFVPDHYWGDIPEKDYEPSKTDHGRCHYDDSKTAPNYVPDLGVQYAECRAGWLCEFVFTDYAKCLPDPHVDHECCVSWYNKCEKEGDCCIGSECDEGGYCNVNKPQVYEDPPGICEERNIKEEKKLWNRCFDYTSGGQGDCAPGYLCLGSSTYAFCNPDPNVKNDCCKYAWDNSNPRPGDCCLGYMAHCHTTDPLTGKCTESQCVPGRETGTDENGNSMLDVHDRICTDPPRLMSFNEEIYECTGAVCGLWGDPHIITCDDLHYDCQAVGLFTIMKNHMFNIQANFVSISTPWGGASITNDIAIDYVKDTPNGVPTMQFSFPNFESIDENNQVYDTRSRFIGACPVMFYVDGEMINISGVDDNGYLYGDANSDHSVKLTNWNQIDVKHMVGLDENGEKYYSNSLIWIEGGGPFKEWSCIFSYFICLPGQEEQAFRDYSVGLLGTPNANIRDDWMAPDGQSILIPDTNREEASFNYCLDNWCVSQDASIVTYEDGLTYEDYKCEPQDFVDFDIDTCENKEEIIAQCADSPQVIVCQMEKCIGNDNADDEIDNVGNITSPGTDDDDGNNQEWPNPPDYGDCANLGAGLSASTGDGSFSIAYPTIASIFQDSFTNGYDNSLSLLVGGNFDCKAAAGFEGRGVFLGDITLQEGGCERIAATIHGSKIHPFEDTVCVSVGGDVSIQSTFDKPKNVMYEYENDSKLCHFLYKGGCNLNGDQCPTAKADLKAQYINTNGEFKQDTTLDLQRWDDEITLLKQKTNYWNTLEANGVDELVDGVVLHLKSGPDSNPVQIFKINPIATDVTNVVFKKDLIGKTVLIIVEGEGQFTVPQMCFHPENAAPGEAPICGRDTFPSSLTASIAWVFATSGTIEMTGLFEMMGSIVIPNGNLKFASLGHSGRMIVGGDLTIDNDISELHNYKFHPASHPLPLGDNLEVVCEIAPPPVCNETLFQGMTSQTACPSRPDGVVRLVRSSTGSMPEDEPILYDIIIEPPSEENTAKTVKFKVDNPFTNHTDIFIKHVKKVGAYAMDPVCETMPFTAGCERDAPIIEVGCHEYDTVDAFALVTIYFASNTDSDVVAIGSDGDVEIDKCCKPADEYATDGYGIISYTFEIQCTCPGSLAES